MVPKVFSWLLKRKSRKIVFTVLPGPNGGSYVVELREGVSITVKQQVQRYSVERYIGKGLADALESLLKEIDTLTDDDQEED